MSRLRQPVTQLMLLLGLAHTVCLGLAGCSLVQRKPYVSTDVTSFDCFALAPVLITGTITNVRAAGGSRQSDTPPFYYKVTPVAITVRIEYVLKGRVGGDTVEISALQYSEAEAAAAPFEPKVGQLRLFPLRRSNGGLRIIVDHINEAYAPIIYSGRHPNLDRGLLSEPGRAVAVILLTIGSDPDIEAFDHFLPSYVFIAMAMTRDGAWVTGVLERLADAPSPSVQKTARDLIKDLRGNDPWKTPGGPCPVRPQTGSF